MSILDIVVVALRFLTRMITDQGLKTDDWLILPPTASILKSQFRLKVAD